MFHAWVCDNSRFCFPWIVLENKSTVAQQILRPIWMPFWKSKASQNCFELKVRCPPTGFEFFQISCLTKQTDKPVFVYIHMFTFVSPSNVFSHEVCYHIYWHGVTHALSLMLSRQTVLRNAAFTTVFCNQWTMIFNHKRGTVNLRSSPEPGKSWTMGWFDIVASWAHVHNLLASMHAHAQQCKLTNMIWKRSEKTSTWGDIYTSMRWLNSVAQDWYSAIH